MQMPRNVDGILLREKPCVVDQSTRLFALQRSANQEPMLDDVQL